MNVIVTPCSEATCGGEGLEVRAGGRAFGGGQVPELAFGDGAIGARR